MAHVKNVDRMGPVLPDFFHDESHEFEHIEKIAYSDLTPEERHEVIFDGPEFEFEYSARDLMEFCTD